MLCPYKKYLESKYVLLASSSPRRKEILDNLGLSFSVRKSSFEENLDKSVIKDPSDYALQTALCKTRDVLDGIISLKEKLPDIVIGADTVVYLGEEILEKPKGTEDAMVMLSKLSGRSLHVCTGVVIMMLKTSMSSPETQANEPISLSDLHYDVTTFNDITEVEFDLLSQDVIRCYIQSGEPLDKAGGFGIQGLGASLIKNIKGDYSNVMGLSANKVSRSLANQIEARIRSENKS